LYLKLITCEILYREVCAAVARSPNRVDVEFVSKGLHDIGQPKMQCRLSQILAAAENDENGDEVNYDAILLGYGLCNHGLIGLAPRKTNLVIPRAHDCITLLLGDRHRYLDYFQRHGDTYFQSSGWIERGGDVEQLGADSIQVANSIGATYEALVEKYGKENGAFLYEQLGNATKHYRRLAFIEMGIEPDDRFQQQAKSHAEKHQWEFEVLQGDMSLIQQLIDGPWDQDKFLTVKPGQKIAASYDQDIIQATKNPDGP